MLRGHTNRSVPVAVATCSTNHLTIFPFHIAHNCMQIYQARNLVIYPDIVRLADDQDCELNSECASKASCTLPGSANANLKAKSTEIAQKAAQDARMASDSQIEAADAAAAEVKISLAHKAIQAARSAEAALAGKQEIVLQLEKEQCEAEAVINEVAASLQSTRVNAASAMSAADFAQQEIDGLKALVAKSLKNLYKIQSVSCGLQSELTEKINLLGTVSQRFECLCQQLAAARKDVIKTKNNAYQAACAAIEATRRANQERMQLKKPESTTVTPDCRV